jgi:hypothetical protein
MSIEKTEQINFDENQIITIVSNDGREFLIDKRCAILSKTIKNLIDGKYKEEKENKIVISEFDGTLIEKVFYSLKKGSRIHVL